MAYIASQARLSRLTISGADYTSNLASFSVSDASALSSGLVSTSGLVVLTGIPGGVLLQDYDRKNFQRGEEVIIELEPPGGGAYVRHPRGLLYVVGMSYDVEAESITLDVGCKIALATLIDDPDTLLPLAPITLDPTQQTVSGVGASAIAAGKYIYQDNQGNLQSADYFDGDLSNGTVESGAWVSVLGLTALSVGPLAGGGAIPDEIALGYSVPASYLGAPPTLDQSISESYYFVQYPIVNYRRQGDGLGGINGVSEGSIRDNPVSACGNAPPPPADSQKSPSCNDGYELVQEPVFLPAYRVVTTTTEYAGPAGQVSRVTVATNGPSLEANSQYYADAYAYCRGMWGTRCNPNGSCSTEPGMEQIPLTYSESLNYYGDANELIKTVTDVYVTELSAAQPFDWRAGSVDGIPTNYTTIDNKKMFRISHVVDEYDSTTSANIQTTTTYTSTTSRQTGIKRGEIDALQGIKTLLRRTSTTTSSLSGSPDSIVSPQTRVISKSQTLPLRFNQYTQPPTASGPYILKSQAPVPFLFNTEAETEEAVEKFVNYSRRSVLGNAYGLQIGEALRQDIMTNWRPNMPFRYLDDRPGTANDNLLAMRMDATVWGYDADGFALVTNGIWVGNSNGSVTKPENVLGDGSAVVTPSVDGETVVTMGSRVFVVDVNLSLSQSWTPLVEGIVYQPTASDNFTDTFMTLTFWIDGFVVGPGSLADIGPSGSMPASNGGDLLLVDADLINSDLFASYTSNSGV